MKLTIFIGGLSGGGAERVCCNLANYLTRNGHDVEFLTMSDDESSYQLDERIPRYSLISRSERKTFISDNILRLSRLKKYLRATNSDIILAMLPITMLLLLHYKNLTSAKIAIAERNAPWRMNRLVQNRICALADRADAWFFQTNCVKDWYAPYIHRAHISVIPNAINEGFVVRGYVGKRKNVIVSAGRLNKQKNQELLIRAFAVVCEQIPDFRLEIYGVGPLLQKLQLIAEQVGVTDKVRFCGYEPNLTNKIHDAYMFVLSSDYEGIPNALMEAMAVGLPCISTDCDGGGASLLIKDEVNGLLVPPQDINSLANAMIRLISDVEFASSLGRKASQISKDLSYNKIYSQWEMELSNIAKNSN